MLFSKASRMIANCSIPTSYDSVDTIGIAFGEDAKYLPDYAFKNGLILDITAAKILTEAGVDVGINHIGGRISPSEEHYLTENEYVACSGVNAYEITVKKTATIQSCFTNSDSNEYPAAYIYENASGNRFIVFSSDMFNTSEIIYRNYMRQKQLIRCTEWIQRKKLPCVCIGNPELYIMCKKDENNYSVGLWNLSEDYIENPEVEMCSEIKSAEFVNCSGKSLNNRIQLNTIQPFGFAGISIKVTAK
jgi:hypothetical protein